MAKLLKCDFYRLSKSALVHGIIIFTTSISFLLIILMQKDMNIGISILGDLTGFKNITDVVLFGIKYQKGLGIVSSIVISVFIGQEYQWKTWQNKWITSKNRFKIYFSKLIISVVTSSSLFLIFELVAMTSSGEFVNLISNGYGIKLICGAFMYAGIGSIFCLISMLSRNSTISIVICFGYIIFSETIILLIQTISKISSMSVTISELIINHGIYAMSLRILESDSSNIILPIFLNSLVIVILSTCIGMFFFKKYEF